jgi:DNA-binding NarL/FixJ family response regulator
MAFCRHHALSPRESAVVFLLALGRNPKAIANELNCSPSTTNTYLKRLLRKLACCCQDKHEITATLFYLALTDGGPSCRTREPKQ